MVRLRCVVPHCVEKEIELLVIKSNLIDLFFPFFFLYIHLSLFLTSYDFPFDLSINLTNCPSFFHVFIHSFLFPSSLYFSNFLTSPIHLLFMHSFTNSISLHYLSGEGEVSGTDETVGSLAHGGTHDHRAIALLNMLLNQSAVIEMQRRVV